MTKKEILLEQLDALQRRARSSKWSRLLYSPVRYLYAMLFSKAIYPRTQRAIRKDATLFWGAPIVVGLPASLDLYLIGGKAHDSEIRLARYLIRSLQAGDHVLDIGAHYGYFSLLAAELVGPGGRVVSCEPASATYDLLLLNTRSHPVITPLHNAVSDAVGTLSFFEFETRYSEYNTLDTAQFEAQPWFQEHRPAEVTIAATTIDTLASQASFQPRLIKIDVEGAELQVLRGGAAYLAGHRPVVVMEYLEPARGNESHRAAFEFLAQLGYRAGIIDAAGAATPVGSAAETDAYLQRHGLESDNIVFRKD